MNGYLKELADLCSVEKRLTTHVARHSFSTCLGIRAIDESLFLVLGHRHIRSIQIYARITQQKLSREMEKIVETLNKEEQEHSKEKQAVSSNNQPIGRNHPTRVSNLFIANTNLYLTIKISIINRTVYKLVKRLYTDYKTEWREKNED